jgi:hypothetical protein
MKVLLLHEFSGVHTELQRGLRAIGVEATTANFGDGYRGFPTDIKLGPTRVGPVGSVGRALTQLSLMPRFRSFDVVQSISASVFNPLSRWLLEPVVLGNRDSAFIYVAASGDAVYRRHIREFPYHPQLDWYERPAQYRRERGMLRNANSIIAAAWDYLQTYRVDGYDPSFLPFPVMTSSVPFREIAQRGRLRVVHPLNRGAGDDYKGTSHIVAAFKLLRARFGADVEFLEVGRLPFAEYMALVADCDVLVDQAYTMAYGMSATYALAQGKVVLSGRESVTHDTPCYRESTVVNIPPDAARIAEILEHLLSNRDGLRELGVASRAFAVKHHDAIVVAEGYARQYAEALKRGRPRKAA